MVNSIQQFLNGILTGIDKISDTLGRFASAIVRGFEAYLDKILTWLNRMVDAIARFWSRVVDYFAKLAKMLRKLTVALGKLLLVYFPAIFLVLISLGSGQWGWSLVGVAYALVVTVIGLHFQKTGS